MAGELASAIALQGQPRNRPASVGPSEAMIDNAFNGRRRADEAAKAKKAADDEKRLNEILKNTAFTKQFDNPYYNRKYQNDAARAMDDIIRTYSEGGENSFVVARNRLRELESIMSTYELADKNMSDARKAASEKPDDYAALFNQQQIGSKTHATMFDALNDPELAGREDEIAEAFESPSAMFMKEKVNGNDVGVAMFSLQNARTLDAFKKAETALKDNSRYTRLGKEFEIKNRNTQLKVVPTHLDDEYLGQVTTEIYSDPSVINNAVVKDFNAAKATAMEIDPSKNFTWKDYQALRGDLRAVAAKDADEFIANARKMTGQPYSMSDKLSAEKESDAAKNAKKLVTDGAFNMTGDTFEMAISGSGQKSNVISIPKGAAFRAGTEKWGNTPQKADIEATPIRIEWNGPGKPSVIVYQSQFAPDGTSMQEVKQTYTYRIPLTKSSLAQAAGVAGTESDVLVREIVSKYSGGPIDQFKKWYTASGGAGSPDEIQPAGTSNQNPASGAIGQTANKAAPQKMDAQGKSYGDEINLQDLPVGAKIEMKNGEAYYKGKKVIM